MGRIVYKAYMAICNTLLNKNTKVSRFGAYSECGRFTEHHQDKHECVYSVSLFGLTLNSIE